MPIGQYTNAPAWTGILPSPARGMTPGEIEDMNFRRQQTQIARDQHLEWLRDQQNRMLERKIKTGQLEFQASHQDEMLQQQYAVQNLQNEAAINEELAVDLDSAMKSQGDYERVWNKYSGLTKGNMPKEFLDESGNMLPWDRAKKVIPAFQKSTKDSIAHQRAMDLAELRGYFAMQRSNQYTQSPTTTQQMVSAFRRTENWLDEKGFDLGNIREAKSNANFVASVLAAVPNAVARRQSNRGGEAVNEERVRQEVLDIAENYIKDNPNWFTGLWKDADFNKEEFLKAVDSRFGLSSGTTQNFMDSPEVRASFSGPAGAIDNDLPKFNSDKEVQDAINRGEVQEGDKVIINGKQIIIMFE